MRTTAVDVAVVGSGPAGAAAARAAAAAGARTLVLERAVLPRYKTCGGGLIGMSQQLLPVSLTGLARDVVDSVSFTADGRWEFARRSTALMTMINRADLDAALIERARHAGACIREGATVTGLAEEPGGMLLRLRDGEVLARVVVGADGTGGRCSSYVGVQADQVDVGLEGEFAVGREAAAQWRGRVLIDWGPVPGSYGWVFPKGDQLTVGVIGDRRQGERLRQYYEGFVRRLGLGESERFSGHLTRCRAAGSPLRRGAVVVAGDAAGLVEPFTREGISFALRSGALAGKAAARAAATRDCGELDRYAATVTAVLQPEISAGRVLYTVFSRHRDLVHHTMRLPPGWRFFVRFVTGETTMAAQLRKRYVRTFLGRFAG
jgi:geranylgeranyl reductase family protein